MPAPPPSFSSFPSLAPLPAQDDVGRESKRRRLSPPEDYESRRARKQARRLALEKAQIEQSQREHSARLRDNQSFKPQDEAEAFLSELLPQRPHSPQAPAKATKSQTPVFPQRTKPTESVPIVIDSLGDDQNFHGLEVSKVPRFRRIGGGMVGGLDRKLRIPKSYASSRKSLPTLPRHPNSYLRYTDKEVRRRIADVSFRRITVRAMPAPQSAGSLPFIPVGDVPGKEETSDSEAQDYRKISREVDSGDDEDDPLADEEVGGESHGESIMRRNAEFDRALKKAPNDVQLWLEFADFSAQQERTQELTTSSESERRAIAVVKIAKLDAALTVRGNENDERLLLARLKAAVDVWSQSRLLEAWRTALDVHPDGTSLWIEYINFRSSTSTSFSVNKLIDVYIECLTVLARSALQTRSDDERATLESNMVYLFLRAVTLLRQTGHMQQALASFQAMIELNLFRPPHVTTTADALDELQDFWDLEAPRIGETGAKGWSNTSADTLPPLASSSSLRADDTVDPHDASPATKWIAAERQASQRAKRPLRASDAAADHDPFGVVLFSDLRPLLFIVWSPSAHLELVYAFLAFLGLPFLPPDVPTTAISMTDSFLRTDMVDNEHAQRRFWPLQTRHNEHFATFGRVPMESERRSGLRNPFQSPFKQFLVTGEVMFAPAHKWYPLLEKADMLSLDVDFASNFCAQVLSQSPDHTFAINTLCLASLVRTGKDAARLAKSFVAADQSNITLYEAYARYEYSRGSTEKARAVYAQALSMLGTSPNARTAWLAWAEMEFEAEKPRIAIEILAASVLPDGEVKVANIANQDPATLQTSGGMRELRARKAFARLVTEAAVDNHQSVALVAAAALLAYLTQGLRLASDIFESQLSRFGSCQTASHEGLWTAYAKMLYRHSSSRAEYRPAVLRDVLERALTKFPVNSIFLSLYAWNVRPEILLRQQSLLKYLQESRMRIQNRVRTLLEMQLSNSDTSTVSAWLFRIFVELNMQADVFSVPAVRTLFERAFISLRNAPSLAIWSLAIQFETQYGDLKRAKSIVSRAIQQCPWAKELYLMPFAAPLSTVYTGRELRDLVGLMKEFGLRVHTDIDAFFPDTEDDITESRSPLLQIENQTEDWEVTELAEREANKPYL